MDTFIIVFILPKFTMRFIKSDLHNHLGTESAILNRGFDAVADQSFESLGAGFNGKVFNVIPLLRDKGLSENYIGSVVRNADAYQDSLQQAMVATGYSLEK
jgi:hypothetical protein